MSKIYDIKQKQNKFIVTKNGEPVFSSVVDAQSMITEFDSIDDAKKYISILEVLSKKKKIANHA